MSKTFHYGSRRSLSSNWLSKCCIKLPQTFSRHLRSSFRSRNICIKFLSVRAVFKAQKWTRSKIKFGDQIVILEWTESTSILTRTLKSLQLVSMMPVRVKLMLRLARSQVKTTWRLWWNCQREKSCLIWKNLNESLLLRKFFLNNLQPPCSSRKSKYQQTSLRSILMRNHRKCHHLRRIKRIRNCLCTWVNKKGSFPRICN